MIGNETLEKNRVPNKVGGKEDPEVSEGSDRELQSSKESQCLKNELVVDIKCFVYWGQSPLGPSKLVFIYSHHNCIYLLLEINR